jgi:hypothetical protein
LRYHAFIADTPCYRHKGTRLEEKMRTFFRSQPSPAETAGPGINPNSAIKKGACPPQVLRLTNPPAGARLCLQDQPQQVRLQKDGLSYQPTWVWFP